MTSNLLLPLKRIILATLTLLVVVHVSLILFGSLQEPQITNRLDLYQTDLLLHTTTLKADAGGLRDENARKALLGADPLGTAIKQYESVRQSAQSNLEHLQEQLAQLTADEKATTSLPTSISLNTRASSPSSVQSLRIAIKAQQESIAQLNAYLGILQAQKQDVPAALKTWMQLKETTQTQGATATWSDTTDILIGLWSNPPRLLPDAESTLQKNLEGWFRYVTLKRLYELQQRTDALAPLDATEQAIAQQTLVKLALVGTIPLMGSVIGATLLIGLVVQRLLQGKQALLEQNATLPWETPWNWEIIIQVLVIGFFFVGQFVVPLVLQLGQLALPYIFGSVGSTLSTSGGRVRAIYALTYYLMMAGAGLGVLYLSIRQFRPLPAGWFRLQGTGNWFLWGLGGYLVALPLMILISLVNQQIWQGQGGSNPLLQIVLEEADPVAIAIFFFTAAVAAPLFEETLFRGFLLPSLTRYVPVWAAILLSALLFAIAHLSLAEVIPLALLGSILGFVYTRSRSLLSSMLLHSLWNSATMIGLLLLGSGTR
jgi:membrane protease YdiL (CAAX protease family)